MGSFRAKIGWKRLRKRENKNYGFVSSLTTRNRKFRKNSKKIQKIEKYHYCFISSQNRAERNEKEKIGRAHV